MKIVTYFKTLPLKYTLINSPLLGLNIEESNYSKNDICLIFSIFKVKILMILLFQLSKALSSLIIHILTAPYILFHKLYNFILSESFCLTYGIILTIRTLMHIYKKKWRKMTCDIHCLLKTFLFPPFYSVMSI